MNKRNLPNAAAITLLSIALSVLTGCGNGESEGQETPKDFPVMIVSPQNAELSESYPAAIRGCQDVDIYPQVSGTITRLCVKEGESVKKGQILFIIDQVPYQATLRTAVANVHSAEAAVKSAQIDYESKQELFREDIISDYDLSMAGNSLAQAKAALEQAKAAEIDARNNLSYTEVKSPVNGVVGTLPFRVGSLVNPQMTQPLTSVSDNGTMYVYFSMTENEMRSLLMKYGSAERAIAEMPGVELRLNDGTVYAHKGHIETFSGMINPETGTISVRAIFDNPDRLLWSGGIGNIIIRRSADNQIVIPQNVTLEIQDKVIAYKVVGGKAKSTFITVEALADGKNYLVKDGLTAGDTIVGKGIGQIKDDMEINIKK